jgi:hypothetical protein
MGYFESGEQELLLEFYKYRNSTKNLFLEKIVTYYRGFRRPFTPLKLKILSNFFCSRELYNIQ